MAKKKNRTVRAKKAQAEAKDSKPAQAKKPVQAKKTAKAKKQVPAKKQAKAAAPQPNVIERSMQFLREVWQELKRVAWPSRKQTFSTTGVVLALVILVSIFLGVVDFVLSRLVRFLIG